MWVELPPRCKLSAHLEHVGGFATHLHHDSGTAYVQLHHFDKIVGGFRVDYQHIGTTNAPIINLCLKHLPFQRCLEVRCKATKKLVQTSFDITDIIRGWSIK